MSSFSSIAKLKWHCRRGTKELDYLLEAYLNNCYYQADEEEQILFKELLKSQDSQLIWYLLGDQLPEPKGLAKLVKKIRSYANV